MYNFRILIQEMRHLRGSFRIYVLIARSSTCLNTGGVVVAEHQATSRALSSLVQTRFDISLPSFLSQQDSYLLGDVKKNQEKLGEDGHRLLAWGSKALEDGRLSNTHCQRKIQEKTVIPKDPVETVGINKTSLPSPGSNGCFEENSHLKMRIRKPFLFRCILFQSAREGWVASCPWRAVTEVPIGTDFLQELAVARGSWVTPG